MSYKDMSPEERLEHWREKRESYVPGFFLSVRSPGQGKGEMFDITFSSIGDARDHMFGQLMNEGDTYTIYYRRPGARGMPYKDSREIWKVKDGSPELWWTYR